MARRYMQVYYDLIDSLTPLSDAERGRLLTAMLEYAGRGAAPDLRGNERFIWPQIKGQIDRDNRKYDAKVKQCSEAGSQGGKANANGRYRTQTDATLNKRTQTDASQDKDKNKEEDDNNDEEEDEEKDRVRAKDNGGGSSPLISDEEVRRLAADLEVVFTHARQIGIPDTYSDRTKSDALVSEYSADWVTEAIKRAGDGPQTARSWRYIDGILRSWRKNGGIDSGKPPDKPKGKTVIEQQYNQREYAPGTFSELTPEEIAEAQKYDT